MGARRDDITSEQRAQMVIEVLSSGRAWGKVSELAQTYQVSRKTIYDIAAKGEQILLSGLQPGPHGLQLSEKLIQVNRNRLVRGSVAASRRRTHSWDCRPARRASRAGSGQHESTPTTSGS